MLTTTRAQSTACLPLALLTAGALCCTPAAHAQSTIQWASPVDGDFADATNWSPMVVPGPLDTASLAGVGPYMVRVGTRTVGMVGINRDVTLAVLSGRSLTLGGYAGEGTLLVNESGSTSTSDVFLPDEAMFTGRIRLNGSQPSDARLRRTGSGIAPVLGSIVTGRGQILGTMDVSGIIDARGVGDRIEFSNAAASLSPLATIFAGPEGAIGVFSSTVSGGTWHAMDTTTLFGSGGTIEDAEFNGQWRLDQSDTVSLGGTITGGEIVVNDQAGTSTSDVFLVDGADVSTRIVLNASSSLNDARLRRIGSGATPVIRGVVTGRGEIVGVLENRGLIEAVDPGDLVALSNASVNQAAGEVRAAGGGGVGVFSSTVTGGVWDGGDGASLFGSGGTISDAAIAGQWRLDQSDSVALGGTISGGEIVVNDQAGVSTSDVFLVDGARVSTTLTLNASSSPNDARLRRLGSGDTPELSGVVRGRGEIVGAIDNRGVVRARPGDFLSFNSASVRQLGGGSVVAQSGGAVGIVGSTITGGVWDGGDGAILFGSGGTIQDAVLEGQWRIDQSDSVALSGDISPGPSGGEIVVNADAGVSTADLFLADGTIADLVITLNASSSLNDARLRRVGSGPRPSLAINSELRGIGQVDGNVDIAGLIDPGVGQDAVGVLDFTSSIVDLQPTTHLEIDLAGTALDRFDRLIGSSSTVTLDGSLDIDFVDGYVPEARGQFEIIRVGTIDGSFADIDIEPVGAIGPAHVVYRDGSVIVVICAADRDADGELTIFDFLAFQNLFDAGDLRADLDEDGQLTIFDFLVFQNRFDAGCG